MSELVIDCEGLTRRFPSGTALDGLTLHARRGEVLALLGPNGAGKTTTMRLLDGVLDPDAGTATVLGLDPWRQGDALRRRTGVLTENAGLDDRFTALENLEFVARLRGMGEAEARKRCGELLERFGMGPRADVKVQGFSTGQRKRVALARALIHDPELLFLDEPTSGLDPAATRDVIELIAELVAEHGRTVVLCTHFLGEAGKLASRMAVLFHGRLHAFGTPAELARDLWSGCEVRLELGGPAAPPLLAALTALPPVRTALPLDTGALVRVAERADVPAVVAACVANGADVFRVDPSDPTLEDVYFEIEARAGRTGGPPDLDRPTGPAPAGPATPAAPAAPAPPAPVGPVGPDEPVGTGPVGPAAPTRAAAGGAS